MVLVCVGAHHKTIKYTLPPPPLCESQAEINGQWGWPTFSVFLGLKAFPAQGIFSAKTRAALGKLDGWLSHQPSSVVSITFCPQVCFILWNRVSFQQENNTMKCFLRTISCSLQEGKSGGREAVGRLLQHSKYKVIGSKVNSYLNKCAMSCSSVWL